MGLFDYIKCGYQLPIEGANALEFQSKDTPAQYMELYEIREDGSLWHEVYDTEDRSDPKAEGLMRIAGIMTRVNKRFLPVSDFVGELRFYTTIGKHHSGWIEFSSYFEDGKLSKLNLIEHRPPTPESEAKRDIALRDALTGNDSPQGSSVSSKEKRE